MFNFAYIRRELEDHILKGTLRNRAELILGPRQVGKSTMLDHLVQNQRFIKLSGEDDDDLSILADPKTFLTLTQQFPNVIIDEAQFVPNIGRVIKRMVDNNTTDSRIFVTGSSALDLGGHLKESAAGRFNSYNLWPLSLEELAEHSSWIEVKRQINDRMIYGCHPVSSMILLTPKSTFSTSQIPFCTRTCSNWQKSESLPISQSSLSSLLPMLARKSATAPSLPNLAFKTRRSNAMSIYWPPVSS